MKVNLSRNSSVVDRFDKAVSNQLFQVLDVVSKLRYFV
jgi:Na+-transporting methylmalonyl-CoA/oxaloacetate decarboxylase beta subunit